VTVAQLALSKQGIGVGPSGADGIYGPITLKATKSFQTAMRLVPDGIIGPLTWSKLRTASVPAPYNKDRGPNYTTRVILSYDDCPLSLTALKNMLLAAKASNTGLVLAPTGNCITAFKSRYGVDIVPLIRSYGQYAINHSVSHGRF
jgi:peptidoglycan hydrolase-like protein with peptidoglycan-binding domain